MIGSPSVFHTAPPQPASNARATCSPLFAGGAEGNQNGFGLLMPAKSMLRSAILFTCPAREQRARCVAAVGDGVDDFFATVDAVAAREDLRISGLAGLEIGDDDAAALVELDAAEVLRHVAELRLADREEHEIARKDVLGARDRLRVFVRRRDL